MTQACWRDDAVLERQCQQKSAEAEEQVDPDRPLALQMVRVAVARDDQRDGQSANPVECVEVRADARALDDDVAQRRDGQPCEQALESRFDG